MLILTDYFDNRGAKRTCLMTPDAVASLRTVLAKTGGKVISEKPVDPKDCVPVGKEK